MTYFFVKLAVITILDWLPSFLNSLGYDNSKIANISTVFDCGAIVGSVTLGYISDKIYSKRSPVAVAAVLCSMSVSYTITFHFEQMSLASFYIAMFFFGFFQSGIANIIAASCASDLGKLEVVKKDSKATSTITGIIDGTGTLGTAVG